MKKILYLLLLAIMPLASFSQITDSKYLAGAVPVVDGKVIFNRQVFAATLTAQQIYDNLSEWGIMKYSGNAGEMISSDPLVKRITLRGMEQAQVRVGLFPSKIKINYYLIIECRDGACDLSFVRFFYTNNPTADNPNEQIRAEDYITDRYAMNKAGTRLTGGTGDYRKNTIDLVESVTNSVRESLSHYMANIENETHNSAAVTLAPTASQNAASQTTAPQTAIPVPVTVTATVVPQTATHSAPVTIEGFTSISPEKIPGNIIKIVADNGIFLTAVNGQKLSTEVAGEGGLGIYGGAPSIFFNMKENEKEPAAGAQSLTLTFKNEVFRNATITMEEWMIIICTPVAVGNNLVIGKIEQVLIK